eukprot:scaffold691_cov181-Ochromonas_danica.AAC.37
MVKFSCRIKSKLLNQLLTCFGADIRKDRVCSIEVSPAGMTLVLLGNTKSSQSQLNMPHSLFENYSLQDAESLRMLTDLGLLTECSKLITNPDIATATLSYSAEKALLVLSLEESSILTVCEINCLEDDNNNEVEESILEAFRSCVEVCQVIVKSELLCDSIEEMVGTVSLTSVQFEVTPSTLKILAKGSTGSSDILITKQVLSNLELQLDGVVAFRCDTLQMRYSYLVGSFLLGIKALSLSHEVCFRLNAQGIMYIQHQIITDDGGEAYLNFLMVPLEED